MPQHVHLIKVPQDSVRASLLWQRDHKSTQVTYLTEST